MSKGEERRRGGREVKEGWGVGERERERERAQREIKEEEEEKLGEYLLGDY